MIKVSLFSLSYRKAGPDGLVDLNEVMDLATKLRLDGVDLEARQFASTEPTYLEDLRMSAFRRGLAINYLGVRSDFGCTGVALRTEIYRVKEWIEVASVMRVPLIRVIGAQVPKGETEEQVWPRLRASFQEITEHGRRHGVRVGLHNHNHGAIPATGKQILRLLSEIDDPYLQHILDTGQFRGSPGASGQGQTRVERGASEELYEHIETSISRAVVIRTKFYRNGDGVERWLDYDRIFRTIKASGFNGPLSIVYEGHDVLGEEVAIPNAVSELRSLARKYSV
jgi:sugar phosphate isomerase/epimerase